MATIRPRPTSLTVYAVFAVNDNDEHLLSSLHLSQESAAAAVTEAKPYPHRIESWRVLDLQEA